jgi:hypothetical protein
MTRSLGLAVVLCATLSTAAGARAASFTVNDPVDAALAAPAGTTCVSTHGGTCTLRAAVQAADNTGGANTITLPSGHYTLTIIPNGAAAGDDANDAARGDLDVLAPDSLTITGAGSRSTAIDAAGIDRVFAVHLGAALSLSGVTVEDGYAALESSGSQNGGGIYSDGGLTLTSDVTLRDDQVPSAKVGGAIAIASDSSAFSASGADFTDDTAQGNGGAIFVDAPGTVPVGISQSNFDDDVSFNGEGGAIFDQQSGALNIDHTQFSDDSTATYGGAVYNANDEVVTVSDSDFDHDDATTGGALGDAASSSMTITGTAFTDNTSVNGALFLASGSGLTQLTDDELDGNHGTNLGGAIYWEYGNLTITSSSLVGNVVGDSGGAIHVTSFGTLNLINTTISGNEATSGGGLYFESDPKLGLVNDTIAFNSAPNTQGGGIEGAGNTTAGGGGVVNTIIADNPGGDCGMNTFKDTDDRGFNLNADGSCFDVFASPTDKTADPLLSPAASNGGPVQTDALGAGSPAINQASAAACPATDARGVDRPQGAGCDIGAFEASTPAVRIVAPASGAKFALGAVVKASYSCSEAGLLNLIASCKGPVASGAAIDTSKPGSHSFSVTVSDDQGLTATATVNYSVTVSPPNTKLTVHKVSGRSITVKFNGSGGSGRLSFRCKLDKGKFKKCSSPKKYSRLSKGRHSVSVEAVDATWRADPTPAKLKFKIS